MAWKPDGSHLRNTLNILSPIDTASANFTAGGAILPLIVQDIIFNLALLWMGMFAKLVGYSAPIISIETTSAQPPPLYVTPPFIWLVFFVEKVDSVAYVGPDREGTAPFGDHLLIKCYALFILTDLDGGLFAELVARDCNSAALSVPTYECTQNEICLRRSRKVTCDLDFDLGSH